MSTRTNSLGRSTVNLEPTVAVDAAAVGIFIRRKDFAMLIMSRKKHEIIKIGDDIAIMVVEIRGDKVRLGIEAPKSILVDRLEISEAKRRTKEDRGGTND